MMLQILLCFAGFIMTSVALAGFGSVIKTTDEMIGTLRAQQPLPPDVYFFDSQGRLHPNINDLQKYRRILQTGTVRASNIFFPSASTCLLGACSANTYSVVLSTRQLLLKHAVKHGLLFCIQ
jgi:hypothetical protein